MDSRPVQENFDARTRHVICAIVENYIETNEPVGSRTLSKILDLGLSPATIRNIMADLTEQGYLEQPHTSAGRVPTSPGYRYFVDQCIGMFSLPDEVRRFIESSVNESSHGLESLLNATSRLLAGLTQFTGIVASPRISRTRLRMIDFIKIRERQVYVVLISQSNMVHHKIIEVSEELPQEFLTSVSSFLNDHFSTKNLEDVRERILTALAKDQGNFNQMLAQAVRLSKKAFDFTEERDLYVEGQSYLVRDFNDIERIRHLLETLEEKFTLIHLMDEGMIGTGLQITIGDENPVTELQDCTMITGTYRNGNHALGALGVIGPTRMAYSRVIPIIEFTARTVSDAITGQ